MNNELDFRISRLKNIQSELSKELDNIRNVDRHEGDEVWKDKNSAIFLDELETVCANIESAIAKIDDTIKEISKTSNNGGIL